VHSDIAGFDMPTDADVERAAAALRLIADPTRIKILWALAQGESNVGCLADLAGTSPTAVSQHLAKLRLAGLVTTRRDRQFVYYAVADDETCALLAGALGQPLPAPSHEPA
jgi:DNA-binding transcriptional ArsR family regulator